MARRCAGCRSGHPGHGGDVGPHADYPAGAVDRATGVSPGTPAVGIRRLQLIFTRRGTRRRRSSAARSTPLFGDGVSSAAQCSACRCTSHHAAIGRHGVGPRTVRRRGEPCRSACPATTASCELGPASAACYALGLAIAGAPQGLRPESAGICDVRSAALAAPGSAVRAGRGSGRRSTARPTGRPARTGGTAATKVSTATRTSSRARFEPRHRWMPRPNAAWRLTSRSISTSSARSNSAGIEVGCRERQQHPVVLLHRATVEVVVLRHHARHRDRRVRPQELLDRGGPQLGLGAAAAAGRTGCWPGARCSTRWRSTWCRCRRAAAARCCRARARATAADRRSSRSSGSWSGRRAGGRRGPGSARRGTRRAVRTLPRATAGAWLTPSRTSCTKPRNRSASSSGKPSMRAMTLTGMSCAYCTAASISVDVAHLVDELVAQRTDVVLPRIDLLRGERRQQQPAGVVVERRVAGDRRGATDGRLGQDLAGVDDHGARREVLGVVGDARDVGVGDRQPRAAVAIAVRHRALARAARPRSRGHAGCSRGRRGRSRSPNR